MIQAGNIWLDNYVLEIQSRLQSVEVGKHTDEVYVFSYSLYPGGVLCTVLRPFRRVVTLLISSRRQDGIKGQTSLALKQILTPTN